MPRLHLTLPVSHRHWTKTPNTLFDRLLPSLKDTELRVLLALIRSTAGWNRPHRSVFLSYRRLKVLTGRHSEAIAAALASLASQGLIHIEPGRAVRKPGNAAPQTEQQTKTERS